MSDKEVLEPVTFELEIQSAISDDSSLRPSSQGLLPSGIHNAGFLMKAVDRVSQGGRLAVTFDVPKWIATGLKSGQYVRKGGLIVSSDGHHVVHWLKEAKVSRIGQVAALATIFVDILSEILLNEKLKEIQFQLETIEEYVKAEHFSPFIDAHEDLKAAMKAKTPTNRAALLWKARDNFRTARGKSFALFNIKKGKIHQDLKAFANSNFSNADELGRIYKNLDQMFSLAKTITHCYQAEARIFEELEEPGNAERVRVECMNFQVAMYEYTNFLIHGNPYYSDLEFVCKEGLTVDDMVLKSFYPLHKHVKTGPTTVLGSSGKILDSQDKILSHREALFERLKEDETQIAVQLCEMVKTERKLLSLQLAHEQGVVYLDKT